MTPDGHFLIDRLPGVAGFYVASGCNVGGLSISPPIGEDLAGWIVTGGERPPPLAPFCIGRFDGRFASDAELRPACLATYVHKYDEQEVRLRTADRLFWVLLSRLWNGWTAAIMRSLRARLSGQPAAR